MINIFYFIILTTITGFYHVIPTIRLKSVYILKSALGDDKSTECCDEKDRKCPPSEKWEYICDRGPLKPEELGDDYLNIGSLKLTRYVRF